MRTCSQPVLAHGSHLLLRLPSNARSLVSFGGFSALAETAAILSAMLPGRPVCALPVTPDCFFPWASVSAVLVQSSARSPASKDDENSVVFATAGGAVARTSAATPS